MGLLSAITGILGARAESKQRKLENYMNSPQGIRTEFEKWGFNPLLGMTNYNFGRSAGSVGDTIARAGASFDEATDRETALEIQKGELELEKDRLEKLVEKRTLSANVPGIYGQRRAQGNGKTGTNAISARNGSGSVRGGGGAGVDLIGTTADVAPDREVKVNEYTSGPGLTEISNRFGTFVVPGDDGEPWGIDEAATAGIFGGAAAAAGLGAHMSDGLRTKPMISAAEAKKAREKNMKAADEKRRKRKQKIRNGYQPNGAYEWPRGVGRMNQTLYP